jgi:uroporphyrinogen-III decarboxylase
MKQVCNELYRHEPQKCIDSHICGNVYTVLDDLMATGLDCFGPSIPLAGSQQDKYGKWVGDPVALLGGVNTLTFLADDPQQVIDEARTCTEGPPGKKEAMCWARDVWSRLASNREI